MGLKILSVAIGGALGAVLRLLISEWTNQKLDTLFPVGTVIANLLGAFVIGFLMIYFLDEFQLPQWVKFLCVTGFLGGLTTFSTFTYEWLTLMDTGQYMWALYYGGIQLIGGLIGCALGMALGRLVF